MKNNAFTLIELLAVIVILAIIALIAVPIVINIINDAKEESLKRSVQYYLDAVTNTITKENLKVKYNPDTCNIQEDGNLICSENGNELTTSDGTKILKIDIKGKKPESGTIKLKDGKVIDIVDININGKYYEFDSKGALITFEIPQAAGLYDEDYKLLASWDELISEYGLEVSDGVLKNGKIIFTKEALSSGCNLVISDTVTEIGDSAFYNSLSPVKKLKSVTIPNSVISIGPSAFCCCTNLKNVLFQKNSRLETIGGYAFCFCESLTSITIPSSVISIGEAAFSPYLVMWKGDTSLTTVIFEENSKLETIGKYAFLMCDKLVNITIPNSVTSIGERAFEDCIGLTSITIGSGVTSIGNHAFSNCSKNLESIKIESGNQYYEDGGANAIIEKSTNKLILGCKNTIIPDGVISIEASAFKGSTIKSITIPSSVTSIGSYAFNRCAVLTNVTIPSNVTIIGENAFAGCSSLTNVEFENNSQLTSITTNVFKGSGIESIIIPSSVTSIGKTAFENCSSLTSVTFENTNGWYVASSSDATSGTNVNVTDAELNVTNLVTTYKNKYWKRN